MVGQVLLEKLRRSLYHGSLLGPSLGIESAKDCTLHL